MQLIHEPDTDRVVAAIGQRLASELEAGRKVTWFLSGGSNIQLIVRSMAMVPPQLTGNLTVLLTDERYGIPGHPDSNWTQLDAAGFKPEGARVLRTLRPEHTRDDTAAAYAADVELATSEADVVIAQFGIGGDGHIAGILPGSEGSLLGLDDDDAPLVVGYDGGAYQRITITPPVWRDIDVAYAVANGETKKGTLQRLVTEDLSIEFQPAQLLKTVPEAYLYTDQQLKED